MKKIFILLLIFSIGSVSADYTTDEEYYQNYLFIDNKGETVVRYYYKKSIVEILVPYNRFQFVKLERMFMGWQLSEKHKYFRTIYINVRLKELSLEPLYY